MAKKKLNSTIARTGDGTIQITLNVPWVSVELERKKVALEMGKDIEVPGFRKGKAPIERLVKHIPSDQLTEHTLSHLLPKLVSEAITEHKIHPAIYPKLELLKAEEGKDWQVRATTAEIPEIELGEYKRHIKDALSVDAIWTPKKGEEQVKPKEKTKDEKEQLALQALIDNVKADIPGVIVDEEVNARLSQLLERIEKLGLSLESYLASIGKSIPQLREEYKLQAIQALKLDFILSAIGEQEKIEISDKEIDDFINAAKASPEVAKNLSSPEQRSGIRSMLRKRKVVDVISNL